MFHLKLGNFVHVTELSMCVTLIPVRAFSTPHCCGKCYNQSVTVCASHNLNGKSSLN